MSWLRKSIIGAYAVLALGLGVNTVWRSGPYVIGGKPWGSKAHRCDLSVYWAARKAVLDGTDIYEVRNPGGSMYTTPPLLAIVMSPLALLPMFWASLTWYVLSVVMLVTAVRMCVATVDWAASAEGRTPFVLYVLPPLLVLWMFTSALTHGQTSILMLWLVIVALYCDGKGREILAGSCVAGAALVKVFPVVLLVYFVWRRKWRVVVSALVALALGLLVVPAAVFGWSGNLACLQKWVARVAAPSLEDEAGRRGQPFYGMLLASYLINNQSPQAVLWRWTRESGTRWVARAGVAVMILTIFAVGRKTLPADEPLILGATLICTVLAPPLAWAHYFMVLLFPVTALVRVIRELGHRPLRIFSCSCLVIFAVLSVLGAPRVWRGYGTLTAGSIVLWLGLVVTAAWRARLAGPNFLVPAAQSR